MYYSILSHAMIYKTISRKRSSKPALAYIADAIKTARIEKALTQRDLSAKVGIPQAHLSKIENGEVDLRLSSVIEIARALGHEIVFVPRALLPAIQSLERGAAKSRHPVDEEFAVLGLTRLQHEAQRLAARLLEAKEFQKLLTTIRDIRHFKLDPHFAGRIEEIVEQIRPALRALLATQQDVKNWGESPHARKQLQQIAKGVAALQQIRNALAHGAVEPTRDSVPAYQLTGGDD